MNDQNVNEKNEKNHEIPLKIDKSSESTVNMDFSEKSPESDMKDAPRNYFGFSSEAEIETLSDKNSTILEKDNIEIVENSGRKFFSGISEENGIDDKKQRTECKTSLGLIAAMYSDSDTDDESNAPDDECRLAHETIMIENEKKANYRDKALSSEEDSEDDSSSSSPSSSSSSSSESEDVDDERNKQNRNKRVTKKKGKSEYDNLPLIEDLHISVPEVLCDPLGQIGWIVDQMVVVIPKPNKPTLNLETLLFIEKGQRVLGRVFDVFGQVSEPHYCVRFNDAKHIEEKNIMKGMTVYYCPNTPYTSLVFMTDLLKMKASDDVGEDEHPEFSDDEEERAYYASLKKKQNNGTNGINSTESNSVVPHKRAKTAIENDWRSQHLWNTNPRNHYTNNPRPRAPDPNSYSQQQSWRPPIDYSCWITPLSTGHPYWPRPFYLQPRSYFPPQGFQTGAYPNQQTQSNLSWQQQTMQQNNWWQTMPPPPPPPPSG